MLIYLFECQRYDFVKTYLLCFQIKNETVRLKKDRVKSKGKTYFMNKSYY